MDTSVVEAGFPATEAAPKKVKAKKPGAKKKAVKPKAKKAKKAAKKARKVTKTKAKKSAKKAAKRKPVPHTRQTARSERLDMRLTKGEKAKVLACASKLRRTVTSIVIEAIEKIK